MNNIAAVYESRYYDASNAVRWAAWRDDQMKRVSEQRSVIPLPQLPAAEIHELLCVFAEPAYQEVATSAFLADYLLSRGLHMHHRSGTKEFETEVVFGSRLDVVVRCDMDALSMGQGRFVHSCGHAINMTTILCLANLISSKGSTKFPGIVFQPAEEGPGRTEDGYRHALGYGGGQYLRAKGVYTNVETLVSFHLDTALAPSEVRLTPGEATAAAYRFRLDIEGVPCHAALPWQGKNPVMEVRDFLVMVAELNQRFSTLPESQYGLVSPTQVKTAPSDLNSVSSGAVVEGISRIVGEEALGIFLDAMTRHNARVELEAPPVLNDSALAETAARVIRDTGFRQSLLPARFRDETAWAGPLQLPWADPSKYPGGCRRVLHFFTSAGENCGHLHSEGFHPAMESVDWQLQILSGIVEALLPS